MKREVEAIQAAAHALGVEVRHRSKFAYVKPCLAVLFVKGPGVCRPSAGRMMEAVVPLPPPHRGRKNSCDDVDSGTVRTTSP